MNSFLIFTIMHIICAYVSMGLYFASNQRDPDLENRSQIFYKHVANSTTFILWGWFGLLLLFLFFMISTYSNDSAFGTPRYHGWLWPFGKKAKSEAGL